MQIIFNEDWTRSMRKSENGRLANGKILLVSVWKLKRKGKFIVQVNGNHWGISNSYNISNNILNISFRRMVWLLFFLSIVLWFRWFLCLCGRRFWRVVCFGSIVLYQLWAIISFLKRISFIKHENLFRHRNEFTRGRIQADQFRINYIFCDVVWRAQNKGEKNEREKEEVRASGLVDGEFFSISVSEFKNRCINDFSF